MDNKFSFHKNEKSNFEINREELEHLGMSNTNNELVIRIS